MPAGNTTTVLYIQLQLQYFLRYGYLHSNARLQHQCFNYESNHSVYKLFIKYYEPNYKQG